MLVFQKNSHISKKIKFGKKIYIGSFTTINEEVKIGIMLKYENCYHWRKC